MPKYRIALRTESVVSDTVDVEHEELTDLRIEVAKFVGQLLQDHANEIWIDEDWRVDVTDDAGLILYVMHLSVVQAPAVRAPKPAGS